MLSAAWVPRRVWLVLETGDGDEHHGPFTVTPPTVRVGLAVSESFEQAKASGFNDLDAFAVLRHALREWLPTSLASLLLSARMSQQGVFTWAASHLSLGAEDRRAYRAAVERAKSVGADELTERPADLSWASSVAEYRHVYGCSFQDVMGEPWLSFVWQLEYVERQRSRAAVDVLRGHPHTGTNSIRTLYKSAYPTVPLTRDEQLKNQQATLDRMNADLSDFDTTNFSLN